MRRALPVALAAAAVISAASAARAEEKPRYPFKSAVIIYRIGGSIQEGSQTLLIDDYGAKTRTERDTTLTLMGRKQKQSIVEIDDGESFYRIDLARKTGEKTPSYSRIAREMVQSMSPEQKKAFEAIGKEITKGHAAEGSLRKVGKGKVLGRECDVYETMGVKTWLWENIPLKKESPALGNMVQEAVELRVGESIPAEKFKPPADIAISESQCLPAAADIDAVR